MPPRRVRRARSAPEVPPYPAPEPPPWALCWVLLHPRVFERGYPDRPLASAPTDFDPAAPAPNRLIRRLRARHAVREAAAASLAPLPLAPPAGGLALYPRPVPESDEAWRADDPFLEATEATLDRLQQDPAWARLIRRELFRHLPRR